MMAVRTADEAMPPSAFAAFKDVDLECRSSGGGSAHVLGLQGPLGAPTPERTASPPLPASLDASRRSRTSSGDLQRTVSAPFGALGLARAGSAKGPPALWRASCSTAVSQKVADTLGCSSVAELCQASYVPPQRLTKLKALGQGAFAEVERAQLLGASPDWPTSASQQPRTVAVKRLKPDVLESDEECFSFVTEARLLINMQRHPSIIEYIGLGCQDDSTAEAQWRTLYLVQEYATGGTLKKLILNQMIAPTRKLYSLGDAVRWGAQIAEGLAHLHSINPRIIHRDLKAENVLLTAGAGGRLDAKLADFGLHTLIPGAGKPQFSVFDIREEGTAHGTGEAAAALRLNATSGACTGPAASAMPQSPGKAAATMASSESDAARQLLEGMSNSKVYRMTGKTGAYCYMAPEVLLCRAYNEKVDVFSFGIVLYELLHRKMIVAELMYLGNAEDAEAHAYRVASGYRMPINADLPQGLQSVLQDCWADNPNDRPSMADVAARLHAVELSGEVEQVEGHHGPSAGCCTVM